MIAMLLKKFPTYFVLVVLVLGLQTVTAQTSNSSIFRFLETTPSARAAALGGNHVALFGNSSELFYLNPAYLTNESSRNVSATFINYLSDIRMGFANGAYNIPTVGTLGFGIRYAGYGELTEYDSQGNPLGELNAGDLAVTTALGTQLSDKLTAGAGVQFIHSSYHTYNSTAITGSAGLYYLDEESDFSAGISIRNLGDQLTYYNDTREDIPFDVSVGFSKKPENFPFHLNLTLRQLNNWDLRVVGETSTPAFSDNLLRHTIFGGEASLGENMKLRLGYNHFAHEQAKTRENFDFAGASIGIGLNIKGIMVDISRNSLSEIGGVVQMSISTKI